MVSRSGPEAEFATELQRRCVQDKIPLDMEVSLVRRVFWLIFAACALVASADKDTAIRELNWEDLLPDDEKQEPPAPSWVDHSSLSPFDNFHIPTGIVPELNGQMVKLPGFIVPLDIVEGKVSSSLLVPYFGACIHMPPPPPNQIVYVTFAKPIEIRSIWDPVWVTGKLGIERYASELAEAGYSMKGEGIEEYRY